MSEESGGLGPRAIAPWRGDVRWYALGCAVVTGIGAGLSKLLAAAGLLPFVFGVVGIFFFMLVGLLLGAILYRFGLAGRGWPRGLLIGSILIPTLATSAGTLVFEYRSFVRGKADELMRQNGMNPREHLERTERMAERIEEQWRRQCGVGGIGGYIAWSVRGSSFLCGPEDGRKLRIAHPQGGIWWLVRAVVSFAAMGWAVGAQVYPLRKGVEGPAAARTAGGGPQRVGGGPGG
jgi:hypothetical protein